MDALICINCGSREVKGKQFLCFACKQAEQKSTLDAIDIKTLRMIKYNQEHAEYLESLTRRYR